MKHSYVIGLLVSSIFLVACGSGSTEPTDKADFFVPNDLDAVTGDPFDTNRLMIVQIQLPENNLKTLSNEGRTLGEGIRSCPSHDFEYTRFSGTVNVDGEVYEDVMMRKKGYLGSITPTKPSFKLDFDEAVEGRRFKGLKRMTLNNNRQDPTNVRQCLAYKIYSAVGIHAPRCSLARVYVNGEDYGIYSHVESIKKPFLARTFGNDEGNLYEAQGTEFGLNLNDGFELKTNKTLNDRNDLTAVAEAIALEDDEAFLSTISSLVDMDEFFTLWAVESIIGNWDSAMGNANNYYVYNNPDDGLFHYIPWGTDAAFTDFFFFKPKIGPIYKNNRIAHRLFEIESERTKFYSKLNELLDTYWDIASFYEDIDKVQALTAPPQDSIDKLKLFFEGNGTSIASLPERITATIANDLADVIDYTFDDVAPNCDAIKTANISASFNSNYAGTTEDKPNADQGSFSFTLLDGRNVNANIYYTTLGPENTDSLFVNSNDSTSPSTKEINLIGVDVSTVPPLASAETEPDVYVMVLTVETPSYKANTETAFHGFANSVMIFKVINVTGLEFIGSSLQGTISLTAAGDGSESNPLSGSMQGTMELFQP